uniref:Leucine-rich repeat-containing N-terminal plant-type domain-containing protein n=1 Tax=Ananas comosus var. bracteatus TaxID=296719 RepID=A0A6V7P2R3_ANACO|nr:unnamed protein product [Ananas comosus var. bracteatus]
MATAGPSAPLGILFLSGLVFATILSANASDADVLLKFKAVISDPAGALRTWTADTAPCTPKADDSSWAGVICDNGTVLGLQLEGMRLSGTLDLGLLAGLAGLRTLSFMNNSFRGAMPDVKRLVGLRSIYLSMNQLSGPIAGDAFDGMWSLKKVHLSQNGFSGPIPASLAAAPKLLELKLDGNRFEGAIPDLRQKELQVVNVSGNSLEGPIPAALATMDADLFAGNKGLCGAPLGVPCASSSVSPSNKSSSSAMAVSLAIAVVATVGIVGLALLALRRQPSRVQEEQLGRLPSSKNSSAKKARTASYKENKLEEGPSADERQSESGRGSGSGSGRKSAAGATSKGGWCS